MAVNLIVGENAYLDEAEASQYFEGHTDSAAWDNAFFDDRKKALITATRIIDRQPLRGSKAGTYLEFPRDFLADESLAAAKDACCEQALWLLSMTAYEKDRERQHQLGITENEAGNARESASEKIVADKRRRTYLCPAAKERLAGFLAGSVPIR